MANTNSLTGKNVAILVTDGFEQVELTGPKAALEAAGARTQIVSPKAGRVQGFNHVEKADSFPVDLTLGEAQAADFDAVLLPGGVQNADAIRVDENARAFVKQIATSEKPIAVICHGGWLLVDAELVRGRTLTSWPSLKVDLQNAGATWLDKEVHTDGKMISSRKPDDIPAFSQQIVKILSGPAPRR